MTQPSDIERANLQIELNFTRFSDPKETISSTPMWKLLVLLRQQIEASSPQPDSSVLNASAGQPALSNPGEMMFADDLMLDFEVGGLGNGDVGYENQFMLQDMQDLPWSDSVVVPWASKCED